MLCLQTATVLARVSFFAHDGCDAPGAILDGLVDVQYAFMLNTGWYYSNDGWRHAIVPSLSSGPCAPFLPLPFWLLELQNVVRSFSNYKPSSKLALNLISDKGSVNISVTPSSSALPPKSEKSKKMRFARIESKIWAPLKSGSFFLTESACTMD